MDVIADATEELVQATHRYIRGELDLVTLANVSDQHIHLLPLLPDTALARQLMGAIEHDLALMDDGAMTEIEVKQDLRTVLDSALVPPDRAPSPGDRGGNCRPPAARHAHYPA